jgi:ubiquinone/menaquinone biosynthesis C-methylase UbiE
MYDRESAAWERRRDGPEQRELVKRIADELADVVAPPGPVADLGCGPGAHALALARRGYDVVGVDGSPRMVEVARTRAARDKVDATFDVHDVSAPLRFADASLGGVLAILVVQHLPHPAAFIAEIRRCLRPGGHLLITAPARDSTSLTSQNLYWRLRAACYQHVPGVVRFYDTSSLPRLVEDQGLTVVKCNGGPGRVSVLARAYRDRGPPLLVGSALQSRVEAQNGARADPATARPNRQGRTKYLSAQSPGDAVLVPDSADDQDCHAYGFAAPHNHPRGQRTTFM